MSRKKRIILVVVGVPLAVVMLCALVAAVKFSSLPVDDSKGHDGASMATALVVQADNEMDGVNYEDVWLALHHFDDMVVLQSLVLEGGRVYDVIELESPSGQRQTVYFDITRFYGKW